MRAWFLLGAAVMSMSAACRQPTKSATPEPPRPVAVAAPAAKPVAPIVVAAPAAPAPAPEEPPAKLEKILVPGDLAASVVRAKDGAPPLTVFMPGMCSNGSAYLQTFPEAAKAQGGVVAIEGDQPCQPGFRSFSWDAAKQHARVEAALAAAGVHEIPAEGITLVGYSQGASLAEQMLQRWPERYKKVVLIGAPTDPSARSLAQARSVVTMACDRDGAAPRMRQAAKTAIKAGVPATYIEMANCTHGNVTDGEVTFTRTFDFLRENERPFDADTGERTTIIVGSAR